MTDKKKTFNQVMVDLLRQYSKDEKIVKDFLKNNKTDLPEKFTQKASAGQNS